MASAHIASLLVASLVLSGCTHYERQAERSIDSISRTAQLFKETAGRYPKDLTELNAFAKGQDIKIDYSPFSSISADATNSVFGVSYDIRGTPGGGYAGITSIECHFK